MAKLSTDELLDAFKEMTLIELSEFVKQFEDTFDVKAAAPVAVAAAGPAAAAAGRGRGEGRVRRRPRGRRWQEDPGHQGRARADRPGPEGGQGPGRGRAEGRSWRRSTRRPPRRPRPSSRPRAPRSPSSNLSSTPRGGRLASAGGPPHRGGSAIVGSRIGCTATVCRSVSGAMRASGGPARVRTLDGGDCGVTGTLTSASFRACDGHRLRARWPSRSARTATDGRCSAQSPSRPRARGRRRAC